MKREWGTLHTLAVAFVLGIILVIMMFVLGVDTKEYSRGVELSDGSAADWHDKMASSLYSPGALHAAHFKSEINCQNCHTPAQKVKSEYCVSCHSKDDFQNNTENEVLRDSHATFIKETSCFTCHTEHRGLEGRISEPLDLAGHKNKLETKLQTDCKQCHQSDYKVAHPNMVNQTCVTCHKLDTPFTFKNHTFKHTDIKKLGIDPKSTEFVKLPYPENGECEECHKPLFHVGEKGVDKTNPAQIEGGYDCLSCHNFNMK